MGTITINGKKYTFTDEKNVLTIIRKAGIDLPTLCYHSDLSTFGACRLCTVENDRGQCFASCSEEPRDGMVIYTHTERLRRHRKLIIELLLAAHCRDCTTCMKSGECVLQDLAHKMGVREVRFEDYKEFRITKRWYRWIQARRRSYGIRISVSFAAIASVFAARFRAWACWALPTVAPMRR